MIALQRLVSACLVVVLVATWLPVPSHAQTQTLPPRETQVPVVAPPPPAPGAVTPTQVVPPPVPSQTDIAPPSRETQIPITPAPGSGPATVTPSESQPPVMPAETTPAPADVAPVAVSSPPPVTASTQPDLYQETLKTQAREEKPYQGAYNAGAAVASVFTAPGRAILCGIGTVGAVVLMVLSFGSGYGTAKRVFEEGCVGPYILTGDDLRRENERRGIPIDSYLR